MRDQIAKLAEMQGDDERPVMTAFNFKDCLAEFDRLSKIEAAAREYREADKAHQDAYDAVLDHPKLEDRDHGKITETSKRWRAASVALDAALAPSTGKSEKPDG